MIPAHFRNDKYGVSATHGRVTDLESKLFAH